MFKNIYKIILTISALFILTNCAVDENYDDAKSGEEVYKRALENLYDKRYYSAIEGFKDVERLFPYSEWATKAQLMAAFANYEDEEYDDAISTLDQFISFHPGYKDIAYAYYLKALSYYEQISNTKRDQSKTKQAFSAFKELIARFPNTKYARDAKYKVDLLNDHLAGKELEVGRYYLKEGKFVAAIGRLQEVIKDYETTSHVKEALHRMVEAYTSLGILNEAKKYAIILGANYPSSKWYARSYNLIKQYSPQAKLAKANPSDDEKEENINKNLEETEEGFFDFWPFSSNDKNIDNLAKPPVE